MVKNELNSVLSNSIQTGDKVYSIYYNNANTSENERFLQFKAKFTYNGR